MCDGPRESETGDDRDDEGEGTTSTSQSSVIQLSQSKNGTPSESAQKDASDSMPLGNALRFRAAREAA
jgi:hypothetical protein